MCMGERGRGGQAGIMNICSPEGGVPLKLYWSNLGHTKLILCFTDCLGQKHDLVGRHKNKNKNDQTSHKFN